jgi:hypothetical protein
LHRKLTGSNSNQHVPSVPNHSPGVPEESATSARLKQLNHSPLSGGSESPLSATPPSRYCLWRKWNKQRNCRESANCGDVTKEKLAPLNGLTTMSGDRLITNYLMQMQQQQVLTLKTSPFLCEFARFSCCSRTTAHHRPTPR